MIQNSTYYQPIQTNQHHSDVLPIIGLLQDAPKEVVAAALYYGTSLEWSELTGGELVTFAPWGSANVKVEWLVTFDEDGILEAFDMTVVEGVDDEFVRRVIVDEFLEQHPGAHLSLYDWDDIAEVSQLSIMFDPLESGPCWLALRFQPGQSS